jgi:hypothetical protein
MKTLKLIPVFIFFTLTLTGKINAQNSEQEAQLTFQLAQEEYDKGNYLEAIKYLDKVQKLNPASYTKVSYLSAKCLDKQLTITPGDDKLMDDLMVYIRYYLENGKDEDKKSELIKIKIRIENSDEYLLAKEFENISKNDALEMLIKAQKQFPMKEDDQIIYSTLRLNDRYLNIIKATKLNDDRVWLAVMQIDLIENRILQVNGLNLLKVPIYKFDAVMYKNVDNFRKYMEEDISSYLLYNYKSHGKYDFKPSEFGKDGIKEVESVFRFWILYDSKNAGVNNNKRMIYALNAVLSEK